MRISFAEQKLLMATAFGKTGTITIHYKKSALIQGNRAIPL